MFDYSVFFVGICFAGVYVELGDPRGIFGPDYSKLSVVNPFICSDRNTGLFQEREAPFRP